MIPPTVIATLPSRSPNRERETKEFTYAPMSAPKTLVALSMIAMVRPSPVSISPEYT